MTRISGPFRPGIRTKLLLLNVLVFAVFGIITAVMFRALEDMGRMTTDVVNREVPRTISVARLGRALSQVFSQTNLLVSTFYGNDAILESERTRLTETTARLIVQNPHPELATALFSFRKNLTELLDRCAQINGALHGLAQLHEDLSARLDRITPPPEAPPFVSPPGPPSATPTPAQILSFREILLEARLSFLRLEPLLTDTRDANEIFSLLNRFRRELRPLLASAAAEPAGPVQALHDAVLAYQGLMVTFNNRIIEFHTRLMELERSMETAEDVFNKVDEETMTATQRLLEKFRETLRDSGRLVLAISAMVIVAFVAFLYIFFLTHIRRPMEALAAGLRTIAGGDLSARIHLNRTDEWREIEEALNEMARKIGAAQAERERLNRQLLHAQKMEAVGTLAGGIAHEFNNLLQGIQGSADLLGRRMDPDDPGQAKLKAIDRAVGRGRDLIQRLLAFSRNAEGRRRPVDLNDEVRHVAALLERTLSRHVRVELDLADNLSRVLADPVQVEQVLMNLAINANDAMPDGGALTVRTENRILEEADCRDNPDARPGLHAALTISDTGIGMAAETLRNIYTPFFTTKTIGKGAGLGLAMVFGIVKEHGGHMTCVSETGQGAIFQIFLPAIASLPATPETEGTEGSS